MDEGEPEAVQDARRFGMPEEAIAALREMLAAIEEGDGALWRENVPVVEAFLCASTQWRTQVLGRRLLYLGLDYEGARAGMEAAGMTITPDLWMGVQAMEAEACSTLNAAKG